MKREDLKKTFYLIGTYSIGNIEGFVKIGDNREEIEDYFKKKYVKDPNDFGVTENSFVLYEVHAKEVMDDMSFINGECEK